MAVHLRVFLIVLLGWFLTPADPALAQVTGQDAAEAFGRTVVAVRFEIEGRPETSPSLAALSAVRVGQPLTLPDLRATMTRLDSLGQFENIVPVAVPAPGGIEVVFHLVPRHPVTRLEVRMQAPAAISADALRDRIQQRYGGVPTTVRPRDIQLATSQVLQEAGHLQAKVEISTELTHDPDAATLIVTVTPGELVQIGRTEIRGVSPYSDRDVIERTNTRPGDVYRRRQIETALQALEEDLRSRGFYEAQVTLLPPAIGATVDLVIAIDTGPEVELRVVPANVLSGEDLETLVPIQRVGSADQDLLEDSQARIRAALKADGYWRSSVEFRRELQDDGRRLVITFAVERGPRYYVDRVELPSTLSLPGFVLQKLIDIGPGDLFDESRFLVGLARVVEEYTRNGYYEVEVTPAYEELPERSTAARAFVVLHPRIVEGTRGVIDTVRFEGAARVPEPTLTAAMTSRPGAPYVAAVAVADRVALRDFYWDRGFRHASVEVAPAFGDEGRRVALTFRVTEGEQVLIGEITVLGNEHVSERAIREELGLQSGQPAGTGAIEAAQRRVAEMGVFRRVQVDVIERLGTGAPALVLVNVVEAPDTTFAWGGGVEAGRLPRATVGGGFEDYLSISPRGFVEIGRRNLGGRNRAVNLFSRVSFKPTTAPGDPTRDGRGFGFTEYRVVGTYRERRAFRTDTDTLVGITSEQARRTSFNFVRNGANAELLRRLGPTVTLSGGYSLDVTRVFDFGIPPSERPLIDRAFPQVRLSMVSAAGSWDRRDDPLDPTRGTFATADLEFASRALGSQVGYVKTFLQASGFRGLDAGARTVLAARGQLGLARGFDRTVPVLDGNGDPIIGPDGEPVTRVVQDLPASQRFFAGGGTTVRGFQLDRLGEPAIIRDGLSLGGNALIVLNAEVRQYVARLFGSGFGVVGFVDGGNVFARVDGIDLRALRGAVGFGVRYDSPLGPIRLDFGFKLTPLLIDGVRENRWEYHLSIGEAF
jgi:outer membrane protein assembly factor BamA